MALPSKNRLKKKKEFDHIFKNGSTVRGRFLLFKYTKMSGGTPKIGFIVPAKIVKKAVGRNKIRRLLANMVQKNISEINKDTVILLLKSPPPDSVEDQLSVELANLLSKIQ